MSTPIDGNSHLQLGTQLVKFKSWSGACTRKLPRTPELRREVSTAILKMWVKFWELWRWLRNRSKDSNYLKLLVKLVVGPESHIILMIFCEVLYNYIHNIVYIYTHSIIYNMHIFATAKDRSGTWATRRHRPGGQVGAFRGWYRQHRGRRGRLGFEVQWIGDLSAVGNCQQFGMINGDLWWLTVISAYLWWLMVINGDLWWLIVINSELPSGKHAKKLWKITMFDR